MHIDTSHTGATIITDMTLDDYPASTFVLWTDDQGQLFDARRITRRTGARFVKRGSRQWAVLQKHVDAVLSERVAFDPYCDELSF